MTVIVGKIETLKRLKETLHSYGIHRFNSIGEINTFLKQYESEKKKIPEAVKSKLDHEIQSLGEAINKAEALRDKNLFNKYLYYPEARNLSKKRMQLVNNYHPTLSKRCSDTYCELEFVKKTVEGLQSLIAGAVGENSVVCELEKLSDSHYLINDFYLEFDPPIFNKSDNDRIYSIQVDHLLVCQSGVFILETKNWSALSVESLDLRSPVEQIQRASYALFVYLNGKNNKGLVQHHWGSKKVQVRNIIVMTNKAPKGDFQHAKVLSLDELNGYIEYFESVFDEAEVQRIFNYLKNAVF